MKKKAQVHMLSTDKVQADNNIFITPDGLRVQQITEAAHKKEFSSSFKYWIPQYLYFTADEEIKDGDWVIPNAPYNDSIWEFKQAPTSLPYWGNKNNCKKVIATTNSELWYKGPFNEALQRKTYGDVPRIGDDFVEAYIKAYNEGTPITEVMLEYEQESLGEVYNGHSSNTMWSDLKLKLRSNGTVIISPMVEKMYSRTEMLAACGRAWVHMIESRPYDTTSFEEWKKEWFNKHYPQ